MIATVNVKGDIKILAYCKKRAEDAISMANVYTMRFSQVSRMKRAYSNAKGIKTPAYCSFHAEDGVVDAHRKRCTHDSCTRRPSFGVEVSTTSVNCKQHAEDDMVDVRSKCCSHYSCMKCPCFDVEGCKTPPVLCKQHAEDSTVDARCRGCSRGSCTRQPNFNVEASKMPEYYQPHAEDDVMDVCKKRFSHYSCVKIAYY